MVTNGSDSSLPSMLAHGAAEALARGWNAFLFDGPGQQSMLFERNVPFRYDWEAVLTPVIDALIERPDVDAFGPDRLRRQPGRLLGHQGRRLRAPPGGRGGRPGGGGHVRGVDQAPGPARRWRCSSRAKRTPSTRPWPRPALTRPWPGPLLSGPSPTASATASTCSPRSRSTRCATSSARSLPRCWCWTPRTSSSVPGQPQELYEMLPDEKEIIKFTRAQGANFHCQPLGRQLTDTLMLDWLQDHLPAQYR